MVMNHKLWCWYEKPGHNHPYVELYNIFYETASKYAAIHSACSP